MTNAIDTHVWAVVDAFIGVIGPWMPASLKTLGVVAVVSYLLAAFSPVRSPQEPATVCMKCGRRTGEQRYYIEAIICQTCRAMHTDAIKQDIITAPPSQRRIVL